MHHPTLYTNESQDPFTIVMFVDVVVEKIGLRRNLCKGCVNRPLHAGASFDKLYIVRCRSADVNILGNTLLLARKSMRISVGKDRE